MSGTPWILKTFQIDQTGSTGAHLYIEARQPGFFAFILNIIGLDPTAELKVTKGAVSFRSTSLSGMTETSTALTQIGSFQGGYSKPIGLLILAGFFLLGGISADIALDILLFTWFGLVLSIVCLIAYALTKYLSFGFETSGGAYYGMSFKRGVLNNVSVDITQVENALQLVSALIGAASLGGNYSLSDKVQKVASQATIVSAPSVNQMPSVAPSVRPPQTNPHAMGQQAPQQYVNPQQNYQQQPRGPGL